MFSFLKKYWLVIVLAVVVVLLSAPKGYGIAKRYLTAESKKKDSTINALKDSIKQSKLERQSDIDTVFQYIESSNNYYYEYIQQRKKVEQLQLVIDDLHNTNFTRQQLDSLADYYQYK